MLQSSRIAIIGLLALMQLFAPLVHAHMGGGQFTGTIHVPGLEFLARQNGNSIKPSTGTGAYPDVIVGLAPGVMTQNNDASVAADSEIVLPTVMMPAVNRIFYRTGRSSLSPDAPFRQIRLTPPPRASPNWNSLFPSTL